MIARPIVRPNPIPFASLGKAPTPCQPVAQSLPTVARRSPVVMRSDALQATPIHAQFLGHGALSVQSTATGRLYRFQGEGHRLQVDPRDALMLGRIPDLLVG